MKKFWYEHMLFDSKAIPMKIIYSVILGLQVRENNKLRRCNREMQEFYEEPGVVNVVKSQQFQWAEHAIRIISQIN